MSEILIFSSIVSSHIGGSVLVISSTVASTVRASQVGSCECVVKLEQHTDILIFFFSPLWGPHVGLCCCVGQISPCERKNEPAGVVVEGERGSDCEYVAKRA